MKKTGMTLIVAAAIGVGAFATSVSADPIADRQAIMKSVGLATKTSGGMVKGKIPFDALKAELAMRTIHAAAVGFGHLFPENSKTGGETEASPKIWSDSAGFQKAGAKFAADAAAGIKAAKGGADSFKAAFGAVVKNCKACHEGYRIKK